MWIDKSYWGVEGWEVATTSSASDGTCFLVRPNLKTPEELHHIIFANDICNGASQGGIEAINDGSLGVDYFAVIGNIIYNAAQGSATCNSGISIYQPVQSDSLPGTHIYVAGNFSYRNLDANPCNGGTPTDGEGLTFDSFDGSQGSGVPYGAQAVADNNILVDNGKAGFGTGGNSNSAIYSHFYVRHNTLWGNNGDTNQDSLWCGEIALQSATTTHVFLNLAVTNSPTGCGGHPIYAFFVDGVTTGDAIYQNWGYSSNGNDSGSYGTSGFSYGPNNIFGVNPLLANPAAPDAPHCSGYGSVPACMAAVVANFTPTNPAAIGYGYQTPSSNPVFDVLFPQWLCNVNLPSGLITMGCLSASPVVTGIGVKAN